MLIGTSAGCSIGHLMQLTCRDGDVTRPTDVAQRYERWPPGDPGLYEDSQELLRLHRVSPLPSVLPHPGAPVMPDLQPGFTAAQALQRVVVRAPRSVDTQLKHPWFLVHCWSSVAPVATNANFNIHDF